MLKQLKKSIFKICKISERNLTYLQHYEITDSTSKVHNRLKNNSNSLNNYVNCNGNASYSSLLPY